jgi:ComF family protein
MARPGEKWDNGFPVGKVGCGMGLGQSSILPILHRSAQCLLDLLYPATCAVCGRTEETAAILCRGCESQLHALEATPACQRCGSPVAQPDAPCPFCLGKGIRPFESIHRLGIFDEPLRSLIHQIKYDHRWPLAELLAGRLASNRPVKQLLDQADSVIPVPLHWKRQFTRGFNQSQVLASSLRRRCRARLLNPVIRTQDTPTQTQLTSQQARLENVRHAFALANPRGIQGQRLVLIDDVMTSGATLQAVARCIMQAKPASLSVIVLAVADPRHRGFTRV